MVEYPEILPMDSVALAIEIVKNRQIAERKTEFAKAEWNIQGYLFKVLLGDKVVGADGNDITEDFTNSLGTLVDAFTEVENEGHVFGAENEEEAVPIVVILGIASAIMQLIQLLMKRKNDTDLPSVG